MYVNNWSCRNYLLTPKGKLDIIVQRLATKPETPNSSHCFCERLRKLYFARFYSFGSQCCISKKTYEFCDLNEKDLEEDFVHGSGPGGQAVNKSSNCVVLKHRPSGVVVKCHETRSLHINRMRARERLKVKLDFKLHGADSFLAKQKEESSRSRQEKKRSSRSRLELKKAFKEREHLD